MAIKTDTTNEPSGPPALPTEPVNAGETVASEPAKAEGTVADGVTIEPAQLDTPESDAAIDDIVAQEADEVLAAQDAATAAAEAETSGANGEPHKHGHPLFWSMIFVLAVLSLIALYVLMNPGLELPFSA